MKKILILIVVLLIFLMLMLPSGAGPAEVVLDQPVELAIPGRFIFVDDNHDRKIEALKFNIEINAYREGNFIVTGNLEGLKRGQWLAIATTVVPFQWAPEHRLIELNFHAGIINKSGISGPYRINISLREGDWEMPSQIAGFSPECSSADFCDEGTVRQGTIKTVSAAKRAVETWASYHAIKLGKLLDINYNYDQWQVNYNGGFGGKVLRFLVSPRGSVQMLKINPGIR